MLQPSGGDTPGTNVSTAGGSVAVLMANLLRQANSGLTTGSQGVYVGEGLAPVPTKLVAKINQGKFIEMAKLLPVFWSSTCRLARIMAKVDVKSAYRNVPNHPQDRWLMGMLWEGSLYIDTALLFGLRSALRYSQQ